MICLKCGDLMDLQAKSESSTAADAGHRTSDYWHCARCFLAAYDDRKALLAAEEHLRDGWDVYRKQGINVISESEYKLTIEGER